MILVFARFRKSSERDDLCEIRGEMPLAGGEGKRKGAS